MHDGKIVIIGSDPMGLPDLGRVASKGREVKPIDLNAPIIQGTFTPSHAKRIRFGDGQVVELNRSQRRAMKLYNRTLVKVAR